MSCSACLMIPHEPQQPQLVFSRLGWFSAVQQDGAHAQNNMTFEAVRLSMPLSISLASRILSYTVLEIGPGVAVNPICTCMAIDVAAGHHGYDSCQLVREQQELESILVRNRTVLQNKCEFCGCFHLQADAPVGAVPHCLGWQQQRRVRLQVATQLAPSYSKHLD